MIKWILILLAIAAIASLLGFRGVAGLAGTGARACCLLTESRFPNQLSSDSRYMLDREASMDDPTLLRRPA